LNISFFHPAYLWGLLALTLPLLIHLINRKRKIKLDFSTVMFFRETAVRASRVRNIRRILLLCVRMLIIAVLVAIFTRPYNSKYIFSLFDNPSGTVFFYVDPTKSMEYKDSIYLWQKAFAFVDSVSGMLPSSYKHLIYDEDSRTFVSPSVLQHKNSNFTRYTMPDIKAMLEELKGHLHESVKPDIFIFISDFQKNITSILDTALHEHIVDMHSIGISVAPRNPWNNGIRKACSYSGDILSIAGKVYSTVKDNGKIDVTLFTEGMRTGTLSVVAGLKGETDVSFTLPDTMHSYGIMKIENNDPFAVDNICYFTGTHAGSHRMLVVGDTLQSFPIAAAFRSVENSPWHPVLLKPENMTGYKDIDSAEIIVLNEIKKFNTALESLCTSGFSGKTIIFSPYLDTDSFSGTKLIFKTIMQKEKIRVVFEKRPVYPLFTDTISTLWKGFKNVSEPDAAITGYVKNIPGNPVLLLDNHVPLITTFIDSALHTWIMFATPIGMNRFNKICNTGMFLPVLDRTVRYAMNTQTVSSCEWIAGKPEMNPFARTGISASVYNDANRCIAQWSRQPYIVLNEPGIYKIVPEGLQSYRIAVNEDTAECGLDFLDIKSINRMLGSMHIMTMDQFFTNYKDTQKIGYSYFLWILLGLLLMSEILLWGKQPAKQ
jgi:hypothetical protein